MKVCGDQWGLIVNFTARINHFDSEMHPISVAPRRALNKAYLKRKVSREEIEAFKGHLITLLDGLRKKEREGHHKNLVKAVLEDAFYKPGFHLNETGDIDLVIHTGKSSNDPVGVIIEAKRPDNVEEMFSVENPAAKSMCELVLYYLRERIYADNQDLRHLVITNGLDWYVFDTGTFDRLFFNLNLLDSRLIWVSGNGVFGEPKRGKLAVQGQYAFRIPVEVRENDKMMRLVMQDLPVLDGGEDSAFKILELEIDQV